METQLKISISGRVQGVNFRHSLRDIAKGLGLNGFVEYVNQDSIMVLAQGEEACLIELLEWVNDQSFPVKIRSLSYEWQEITTRYNDFKIRRYTSLLRDQLRGLKNLGKSVIQEFQKPAVVPEHIVIIPDGNRRWARERGMKAWQGHQYVAQQSERLRDIYKMCIDMGINYISVWGFSTENWKRDQEEVEKLMQLFQMVTKQWAEEFATYNIRFRHIGRTDRLPAELLTGLNNLAESTKNNTQLNVQLFLDYGGRDDIVQAVNKIISDGVSEIDEQSFGKYLDTYGIPDPDFIIRTSGEQRTSGMMPFEGAYAELYFTNIKFPDFDQAQFHAALMEFASRVRRFGGTAKQDLQLKPKFKA